MFAYCLNNPVSQSDPLGKSAITEGLKNGLWVLPFLDLYLPIGDLLLSLWLISILLPDQQQPQTATPNISSHTINWNPNNNLKNHILKGTKGKHIDGWKRFGIDPDNNNAWGLVVPILKEVLEKADDVQYTQLSDGSMIVEYIKTYAEQGVQVVFKIWIDASGVIQQISDAIPYIMDK